MNEYILILPILVSFIISLILIPKWIKRAFNAGLVGKDMNKFDDVKVAEAGGVNVIAGFIIGVMVYIAIKTFYFKDSTNTLEIFALLSSILIISFIGMIDDLLGWKIGLNRRVRLFLVLFGAVPLMVINAGTSEIGVPFFSEFNLSLIYPLIIIPLGVMGASTTFNFLAGYNGLESRQGIIILSALAIATFLVGNSWLTLILLCMVASLIAFLFYNSFPAKVFPGDTLTYSIGALIASVAILGNIERFAIFIFIPNILEILLKLRGSLIKESFAEPEKDGTLSLKYSKIYGLEHLALVLIKKIKGRVYEKDVVNFINLIQILFVVLGFIIFRNGLSI